MGLEESVRKGLLHIIDINTRYNSAEQIRKWANGYINELEIFLDGQANLCYDGAEISDGFSRAAQAALKFMRGEVVDEK